MMGKLYYLIGKSSTGKDTILKALLEDKKLGLSEVIQYTTRPKRDGETECVEYHFIDLETADAYQKAGKIIEIRAYNTVHGIWKYMMVDDGAMDLDARDYAAVGTAEAYRQVRAYFPEGKVVPIYIDVEKGERIYRALMRERTSDHPKYEEMCRRFLADEKDFSEEKLVEAGLVGPDGKIVNRIENKELKACVKQVKALIRKSQHEHK